MARQRILVLCTGNSARSQIAEAWFRYLGGEFIEVASAGTNPVGLHPLVSTVMSEVGVATLGQRSKHLRQFIDQPFDVVITVCDRAAESCPVFPGAESSLHWPFDDPAAADHDVQLAQFRQVRDQIGNQVRGWLKSYQQQVG